MFISTDEMIDMALADEKEAAKREGAATPMTTPRLKTAANLPGTTGTSLPGRLRGPVVRQNRSGDGPIAAAMKQYGIEMDNGRAAEDWRFMRWDNGQWYVHVVDEFSDTGLYRGDSLADALAVLLGEGE